MSASTSNERGKSVVGDRPGQSETQRKQNTEQDSPTQGRATCDDRLERQRTGTIVCPRKQASDCHGERQKTTKINSWTMECLLQTEKMVEEQRKQASIRAWTLEGQAGAQSQQETIVFELTGRLCCSSSSGWLAGWRAGHCDGCDSPRRLLECSGGSRAGMLD